VYRDLDFYKKEQCRYISQESIAMRSIQNNITIDPIRLELFRHIFSAIAEEMGVVLRKASFSPNIKERRDYSCAVFNAMGSMIAQAANIPVHLGSMQLSVASAIEKFSRTHSSILPGDCIILNDPYQGGTHLPDITLITPVFIDEEINLKSSNAKSLPKASHSPFAYVACRAHHADVGGISPGSMPIAREIYQEGLIIPPIKLISEGKMNNDVLELILSNVRTPDERSGDLYAQVGANQRGHFLINELIQRYDKYEVTYYMNELLNYTERVTRQIISTLPNGSYSFTDYLDNDGITEANIPIRVTIYIENDTATVDFTGTAVQQEGSVNAVYAITFSAVNYVFRTLIGLDVPNNSGCLAPVIIIAPIGTLVNAIHPASVSGGNVETSQRIVDVLLGALAQACPDRIPAASQGTMNNVSIGGWNPEKQQYFTYYETIGGGTGASHKNDGIDSIHSHMTNTLNTPIEALEYAYPLQITRYEIRKNSGGKGYHTGGNGIIREIKLLVDAQVTLLTERRVTSPYSFSGGAPGKKGENILVHENTEISLPGKGTFTLLAGDMIRICTPGGGGFGKPDD
jgi:N-methylhydantoinase B